MFIVTLTFSANRDSAGEYLERHKEWIRRGFDDGVFLLAGGLQPGLGGCLLAHNTSYESLASRVNQDPFVVEGIVMAEILDVTPTRADDRLAFLFD